MDTTEAREPCSEYRCDNPALDFSPLCGAHYPWSPVIMGPSWQRGEDGKFVMPEQTLGWECLKWCRRYLQHQGKPWMFTKEQARLVLWWYALDPQGEFHYSTGVIQRSKGVGKDFLLAAMAAFETLGKCRFSHWDDAGNPVAVRAEEPWVQIAAVSQTQSRTTMKIFPGMFTNEAKRDYRLNIGKVVVHAEGGRARIESVTSSPAALEGGRPSLFAMNEALALDTPIPTPSGWTTMGEVQAGDVIYGAGGAPTTVVRALPTQVDRRCFRVNFKDGTSIVASDGHLWAAYHPSNPTKLKVLTTQHMFEEQARYEGKPSSRFRLPRPGPRQLPNVNLPVDPYLVGTWLGDGSTGQTYIASGADDVVEFQAQLALRGVWSHAKECKPGVFRVGFSKMTADFGGNIGTPVAKAFRKLPCYRGEKHIPTEYMNSSVEQRLELLRGLMDTDGCASTEGSCIFVGRKRLAADVQTLLRSLGQTASLTFAPDPRSREGGCYRVTFTPLGIQPFALPRKVERVRNTKRSKMTIVSIEEVDSVPVRCIEVDAEDHLFQAGPTGQVTHNTHRWDLSTDGHEMAETGRANAGKVGGRALAFTNAYQPGRDSVAQRDREGYEDILAGRKFDPGYFYDSLEAPPEAPLDRITIPKILEIVRGDSVWMPIDSTIRTILNPSYPPARARRFYYNQIVALDDQLVSEAEWRQCRLEKHVPLSPGDEIVLGLDGSKSNDATALVALRLNDKTFHPLGIWEPSQSEDDELPQDIDLDLVDGHVAQAFATYQVRAFFSDVEKLETYVNKWSDEYRDQLLIKATPGKSAVGFDMRGNQHEIVRMNEMLVGCIRGASVHWARDNSGDKKDQLMVRLTQHVLNAYQRPHPKGYGMSFGKKSRESKRKVDGYAAMLLAFIAMNKYLESGKRPEKPQGKRGWIF